MDILLRYFPHLAPAASAQFRPSCRGQGGARQRRVLPAPADPGPDLVRVLERELEPAGDRGQRADDPVPQGPGPRGRPAARARRAPALHRRSGAVPGRGAGAHAGRGRIDADLEAPGRDQESAAREARERIALVERRLRELPEQQRRCLVLVVRDELSYAEVGELLGLSFLTVRNHVARARAFLRRALADEDRER